MLMRRERGDTLIEVLLAIAILAVIITGVISFMNYGISQALSSAERAEVQALINGQANVLRAARDEHSRAKDLGQTLPQGWDDIKAQAVSNSNPPVEACGSTASKPFYFGQASGVWTQPIVTDINMDISNSARTPTPGDGVWIEAYDFTGSSAVGYYDFYIKSCWSPYGSGPGQELKTVVRLYED